MKRDKRRNRSEKNSFVTHRLLTFLAAAMVVFATTGILAAGAHSRPGSRKDRDDKKGEQARDDRDDRARDDFDWDDHSHDHHHVAYAIGLWGDMPYSDAQALTGVPNLIADMNSQDLVFTAHDGDLKAGSGTPGSVTPTTCADAKYVQALGYLNALKAPAVFTPGDNDWTDCDAASNGPFNSLERLDHERQLFFNTPFTQGMHRMYQAEQTDTVNTPCLGFKTGTGPLDLNGNGLDPGTYNTVACVENRRWTIHGVTYATLDIQGSCDNRCKDHPDPHEADVRQAADIAWMQETFQVAKDRDSAAIMFISQADPGFAQDSSQGGPLRDPKTLAETDGLPDGFQKFLLALRTEVIAFRKPVAFVHGDSHYFRIDKPFEDALGERLENFIRVETFGDHQENGINDNHWVKVFVDPDSREVFSFQPQTVPGNRVAVPAP